MNEAMWERPYGRVSKINLLIRGVDFASICRIHGIQFLAAFSESIVKRVSCLMKSVGTRRNVTTFASEFQH